MDSLSYDYRRVSYGDRWFIEIRGLYPSDQIELDEILSTLNKKHGWPIGLQVLIVGPNEEGIGAPNSTGLAYYNHYRDVVRVGPYRNDVSAPMKRIKDTLE